MQSYYLVGILIFAGASLALNLYLLRKIKWVFALSVRIKQSNDLHFRHLFRQIQILQALQQDLDLPNCLPPTGGKAGSPDFLKVLADHIRAAKPETVVECGSGISTVVISRCLQLCGNGHLYSMEHMPEFAEVTRNELKRQGLSEWATVIDAPLVERQFSGRRFNWYTTDELPEKAIELLVIDGPPARTGSSPRYPAGPVLFPLLSKNAAVFIDDAGRPEEIGVVDDWRSEFKEMEFEVNTDDFQKGLCVARPIGARASCASSSPANIDMRSGQHEAQT